MRSLFVAAITASALAFPARVGAQELAVEGSQEMGTAFAFSLEPSVHFVNTMAAGTSTASLAGDGIGLGAFARGMLFPFSRPQGAHGFGVQASAGYSQLFAAGSGLVVGAGGLRYVLGAARTAYWIDVNGGYGVASDSNIGGAPYLDIGIGWQFAATPNFLWGIAGRWSFFFPREQYVDPVDEETTYERNYSLLSLALVLEWGPPRWQEPTVTPIPIAQQQPGPVMAQPMGQPTVQPGPAVIPQGAGGPGTVQPIPISSPGTQPPVGATPPDQDGDGIGDEADACPAFAEDFNQRQDTDGCPDADRDADGVPDVLDQCAERPEDFDAVRDEDGCPD